jgi:sugar lactone lactonase YvrE
VGCGVLVIPSTGQSPSEINVNVVGPSGVAVDPSGRTIFVTDWGHLLVKRLHSS